MIGAQEDLLGRARGDGWDAAAAADANDRERAFGLMTAKCAERERTWAKSFSGAIFDRGYSFQVVRLMGNDTQARALRSACG